MNLEELLGELRGNVLRDDAKLASGPDDELWSDETLVRYINDAQSRFARRTLSLRDASTPEVVEVNLAAGVSSYVLHESILAVVSARYDVNTTDLGRIGRTRVQEVPREDVPYFDPTTITTYTPGPPIAFSTDEALDVDSKGAITMVVYPAPTTSEEGKIVHLRTARLPLTTFSVAKLSAVCELQDIYHLDMLEWAAYRALRNSDIDGHSDSAKAHEDRFNAAVSEVLMDVRRKMRAPMEFQFGRNGFNWGS